MFPSSQQSLLLNDNHMMNNNYENMEYSNNNNMNHIADIQESLPSNADSNNTYTLHNEQQHHEGLSMNITSYNGQREVITSQLMQRSNILPVPSVINPTNTQTSSNLY